MVDNPQQDTFSTELVGTAVNWQGTGFTICVFDAADVPDGTKLYTKSVLSLSANKVEIQKHEVA